MAFTDNKITEADIAAYGVQSQPNKLTGTAAQNKKVFDKLVTDIVKEKLNGLIDALMSAAAADEIGVDTITGITADTVQEALEAIVLSMQGITQGSVADGSINEAKLAPGAVTTSRMAALAVTTALIAAGAVTTEKIADGAVSSAKIAELAVTAALIASNAITSEKIADGAVGTAKIANTAVDNTKLAADSVTAVKIAALAVTAAKIAAGAVTAEKLGSDILPANVGIKMGTAVPTAADITPGQSYLQYS